VLCGSYSGTRAVLTRVDPNFAIWHSAISKREQRLAYFAKPARDTCRFRREAGQIVGQCHEQRGEGLTIRSLPADEFGLLKLSVPRLCRGGK